MGEIFVLDSGRKLLFRKVMVIECFLINEGVFVIVKESGCECCCYVYE